MALPKNPYGRRPGEGISLSGEYRPTPSVTSRNYFPTSEPLATGEMRISFPGSTPWPPTQSQSGTAIMVELGTDSFAPRRFFFDLGNGSIKNIMDVGVLPAQINDIFISHLRRPLRRSALHGRRVPSGEQTRARSVDRSVPSVGSPRSTQSPSISGRRNLRRRGNPRGRVTVGEPGKHRLGPGRQLGSSDRAQPGYHSGG